MKRVDALKVVLSKSLPISICFSLLTGVIKNKPRGICAARQAGMGEEEEI